jgi:hypothetical protein
MTPKANVVQTKTIKKIMQILGTWLSSRMQQPFLLMASSKQTPIGKIKPIKTKIRYEPR